MQINLQKNAEKFAYIRKKLYLCTLFQSKSTMVLEKKAQTMLFRWWGMFCPHEK